MPIEIIGVFGNSVEKSDSLWRKVTFFAGTPKPDLEVKQNWFKTLALTALNKGL
jgi:hypothetical protein